MSILLTIIALIIVLGIVIFVHELGHFLAARWAGVRVDTFSIGFGPALIQWHDKHGTKWKIAALPLGGFVSIYGQSDMFNPKAFDDLPEKKKVGHYLSISLWKRFVIISAGVFMNFLLAWVIYTGTFIFQPKQIQLPVIAQVVQESPAFDAGIKAGDTIVRINDAKVTNWGEILIAKELGANKPADIVLIRDEKLVQVEIQPMEKWGLIADGSKTEMRKKDVFSAMYAGTRETYVQSKTLLIVLKQIITGERSSEQLGSFITIAQISGQALSVGIFALLAIIALISVNLAVINLLPLPVLDGGYLLMIIVEAITGKKLQGRALEITIMSGWILILGLFALTMWNDLVRVFS